MPPRGPPRQAEKAQRAAGSSIRYTKDGQVPLHRWHLAATIFLYHPRRKTRERLSAGERSQNRSRRVSVCLLLYLLLGVSVSLLLSVSLHPILFGGA
jgi:hypothetical protein